VGRAGADDLDHPILGGCVETASTGDVLFVGRVSRRTQEWLLDYQITGVVLVPGTALLDLAIRAADEVGCNRVAKLELETPLLLQRQEVVQLQVAVGAPDDSGARSIAIYSRGANSVERAWTRHALGVLDDAARLPELDAAWPPAGAVPVELGGCYEQLAASVYEYGPALRGLTALWRRGTEVFAEVRQPEPEASPGSSVAGFGVHPAILDAALHALAFAGIAAATG
jgi:acyl transferase domain-containing protein